MEERRSIAETLKAFFISPFLRLQKVTWRLVVFSILLISIFPRPILLVKKKKNKKRGEKSIGWRIKLAIRSLMMLAISD
ncbi:unnamed protein product [Spirodela intermedia]|uniref:Uncharacterized protein n=1 Tax=Spirodela intermedia TaxID=51605 RepID=A0A7I8KHK9_SPIIN|nr:unnamed protein product [Spirodela intermedia]